MGYSKQASRVPRLFFCLLVLVSTILLVVPLCGVSADFPQIHRALPGSNGKPGYRVLSSTVASRGQDKQNVVVDNDHAQKKHTIMDFESDRSHAVVYSLVSAVLVGLSGIFPLLVIPLEAGPSLKHGAGSALLKLLLSFAVGSLLGDVFLHLLPESWATVSKAADPHWEHTVIGLWVIAGVLSFLIIEKLFMEGSEDDEQSEEKKAEGENCLSEQETPVVSNGVEQNGITEHSNGTKPRFRGTREPQPNGNVESEQNGAVPQPERQENQDHMETASDIKVSGYLNLLANCIDNFTHGLAVGGSYLISPKVGLCTTIAILLHEIPHEVGDFAILLRSGFDRWKAAKAQVLTASFGMLGALFALYSDSAESAGDKTAAILPFTAGGFIYIALVTVVPDLLKETSLKESIKQICGIIGGILSMLVVTAVFE